MAKKPQKFKRGEYKKSVEKDLGTPEIGLGALTPEQQQQVKDSAKDMLSLPIEVDKVRHLRRQSEKLGNTKLDEKLTLERDSREAYNNECIAAEFDNMYTKARIPKGHVIVKMLKTPIVELSGFLKPDLIKRSKIDANGQETGFYYEENKFPYLDAGVVVQASAGAGVYFDASDEDMKGALVTLKLGTRMDQKVAFIDKSDVDPTYFEGHILLKASELEFILATKADAHREDMFAKVTGKVAHSELQKLVDSKTVEPKGEQKTDK